MSKSSKPSKPCDFLKMKNKHPQLRPFQGGIYFADVCKLHREIWWLKGWNQKRKSCFRPPTEDQSFPMRTRHFWIKETQGGSDSLDPPLTLFGEAGQSPSKEKTSTESKMTRRMFSSMQTFQARALSVLTDSPPADVRVESLTKLQDLKAKRC